MYLTIEIRHLFAGIHHSAQFIFEYFSLCMMFCKNVVLYSHLMSFAFVRACRVRCCKRRALFKCHKSQRECLECSKTPGQRSETQPLLSALRARALSVFTINPKCGRPAGHSPKLLCECYVVLETYIAGWGIPVCPASPASKSLGTTISCTHKVTDVQERFVLAC